MTLNVSGAISVGGTTAGQSINLELGVGESTPQNFSSLAMRTLANDYEGEISLQNFYSKVAGRYGQIWRERSAGGSTPTAAYGNDILMLVKGRSIQTTRNIASTGGTTWEVFSDFPNTDVLNSVSFGFGLFVLITGLSPTNIFTSPDGITWTQRTAPGNVITNNMRFTGTKFLLASNGGLIARSVDGITWTRHSTPVTTTLRGVAGNDTINVAVGDGGVVLSSPDGITWTQRTSNTTATMNDIVWTGTQFVTCGSGITSTITSPDGINWTARTTAPNGFDFGSSIAWNGTIFVVSTWNGGTTLTSPDGITWTVRTGNPSNLWTATDGGTLFSGQVIWVNPPGSTSLQRYFFYSAGSGILRSNDGLTWTIARFGAGQLWGIATDISTSNTIAVGEYGMILQRDLTVATPVKWNLRTSNVGRSIFLFRVEWANSLSRWVAVGQAGTVVTSPDGSNWTTGTTNTTSILRGVTNSASRIVAVGTTGTIISSDDSGVSWTVRTSGTTQQLESVAWSGTQFVAVGGDGTIVTSPDGSTWTIRTSGTTTRLEDIIWTGSKFIAITANNGTWQSTDGITWSRLSAPSLFVGTRISYSGTGFIATSFGTAIRSSPDGITWTDMTGKPITAGYTLRDICWDGNRYSIIGTGGVMYTSP